MSNETQALLRKLALAEKDRPLTFMIGGIRIVEYFFNGQRII